MKTIEIGKNDGGQRLDRFLRKYLPKASLGAIYKGIRKDVKVNGKRGKVDTLLREGDVITLYFSDDMIEEYSERGEKPTSLMEFKIIYEDENVLIVDKPSGLLTHGDSREKKRHLANQVIGYLIEKGDYFPRSEATFVPAPANRLDRNTSGIVVFGKTAEALRRLNEMFKHHEVEKRYLAVCTGEIAEALTLVGAMRKNEDGGKIRASLHDDGKSMNTKVFPVKTGNFEGRKYTLTEVEIETGRTHQIRLHLSATGHPIVGDEKYGGRKIAKLGVVNQALCAYRLGFPWLEEDDVLAALSEKTFFAEIDGTLEKVIGEIFGINVKELRGKYGD